MKITITERIAMHNAAINNLNIIQQMAELEKEFDSSEATRIKNRSIEKYAEFLQLLCQTHVEYALTDSDHYSATFSNLVS